MKNQKTQHCVGGWGGLNVGLGSYLVIRDIQIYKKRTVADDAHDTSQQLTLILKPFLYILICMIKT